MKRELKIVLKLCAYEHFTTQAGKKSKTALENFSGRGAEGPRAKGRHMGLRAERPEKTNNLDKEVKINFKIFDVTDQTINNYNTHVV